MASETGICNSALSKIGAQPIVSLTEGTENANRCNEQYGKLRDNLLRSHIWNFAIKRVKLAQLAAVPVFGFEFSYQLPADWLRTVSVHDNDAGRGSPRHKIEGQTISSDASDIYLRYVCQVTDTNQMTADFREALAFMIAADLAIPIQNSNTVKQLMERDFKSARRAAKSSDAIEDHPEDLAMGSWMTERF